MKQLEGGIGTGQGVDAHRVGEEIVTPLRKRRLDAERNISAVKWLTLSPPS
jgi:hypothetical protein